MFRQIAAFVKFDEEKIVHFLDYEAFIKSDKGWYYDGEHQQVIVKFDNPTSKTFKLQLSHSAKDLLSL